MSDSVHIRDVRATDAEAIARVYNPYILRTIITFEEVEVDVAVMARRIADVTADWPWLVSEDGGSVYGYAYASKWNERTAYRHSVQSTIYLDQAATGRGLGTLLYGALFDRLKKLSCHTVLAGISLPNPASVALHEKCGFKKVGHLTEVGYKFGRWVDVGYWQVRLSA